MTPSRIDAEQPAGERCWRVESSIDMYNNDVGKRFMKQTGALKDATLYFASVVGGGDAWLAPVIQRT
jgi:hypothetical protein